MMYEFWYMGLLQYIYIYKGKDTKIYPISSLLMLVKKCKSDTTQEFHKDSKGSV